MVVDKVQDQRQRSGREVLQAPYGLLPGVPQGRLDAVLKGASGAVRKSGEETNYLIQTVPSVDAEPGPGVAGRDSELHHFEVIGNNVEGIPSPSSARAAKAITGTDVSRSRGAVVASRTTHTVRSIRSEPRQLQQRCAKLSEPGSERRLSHSRILASAGKADPLSPSYVPGSWCAVVPGGALHPVRSNVPEPSWLQQSRS